MTDHSQETRMDIHPIATTAGAQTGVACDIQLTVLYRGRVVCELGYFVSGGSRGFSSMITRSLDDSCGCGCG